MDKYYNNGITITIMIVVTILVVVTVVTIVTVVTTCSYKKIENLDAHTKQWFTDGYRTSVPGTNTCREDTDCEIGEICQSGYCAGLRRYHDLYGIFRGNEYKDVIKEIDYDNYDKYDKDYIFQYPYYYRYP